MYAIGRPLRIAVIGMRAIPCNYSGIERASECLYSRLAERGHAITIYCRPDYLADRVASYRGLRLLRIPTVKRKSMETLCHAFLCMLHGITCDHYDVIQLHALASGTFSVLGRLAGIPTVTKIHGLDWQRAKWNGLGCMVLRHAERSLAKHSTNVTVVSKALQSYFAQEYGLNSVYIPNGVERSDSTAVLDHSVLDQFNLSPERFIAYIGRLVPEKRIEDLILAFGRVTTPYKLVIAGEAGYTDTYVNHLRSLAATDARIVFTGLQKGAALQTLYRAAAVFVLPSDLEGLPNSLLECMEYATPAIVSDIAPHRELLGSIPGYDLFVTPRDVEGLTERLVRLLRYRERYAAVAVQAQAFVRRFYSWEHSADLTEEVFYRAAQVKDVSLGTDKQALSTEDSETRVRRPS